MASSCPRCGADTEASGVACDACAQAGVGVMAGESVATGGVDVPGVVDGSFDGELPWQEETTSPEVDVAALGLDQDEPARVAATALTAPASDAAPEPAEDEPASMLPDDAIAAISSAGDDVAAGELDEATGDAELPLLPVESLTALPLAPLPPPVSPAATAASAAAAPWTMEVPAAQPRRASRHEMRSRLQELSVMFRLDDRHRRRKRWAWAGLAGLVAAVAAVVAWQAVPRQAPDHGPDPRRWLAQAVPLHSAEVPYLLVDRSTQPPRTRRVRVSELAAKLAGNLAWSKAVAAPPAAP